MMIDAKTLRLVTQSGLQNFAARRILDGIAALQTLLPHCPSESIIRAEAESLEENYHHMLSFLRQGGNDRHRHDVQTMIQRQGVHLLEQTNRAIRISLGSDIYSRVKSEEMKNEELRMKNEELRVKSESNQPEDKSSSDSSFFTLHSSLQTPDSSFFILHSSFSDESQDDIFDVLWTSPIWTAQDTALWYDFILRQRDMVQQHLAGAVFLAACEHYDAEKMQLLNLLADSECHRTHITAVCYLLLLRLRHKELVPLMPPLPDKLLRGKGRKLIAQVEYEFLLMLISEKDMEKELKEAESLTKEVISGLSSALSPGEEKSPSRLMHALKGKEEGLAGSLKSIISMRGRYLRNRLQRGLDINLSKIPLLHTCQYMRRVSHWFMPFDKTHPLFQSVMIDEKGNEKHNLSTLVDLIMDCDVDKLAMLWLVAHDKDFSKAVRQLDEQELPDVEDAAIPEYTFRFIMQDLYRFFFHSPLHAQLINPFRQPDTLLSFPQLAALFSAEDTIACCRLLFELGRADQVLSVLDDVISREGASAEALLLKGQALRAKAKGEKLIVKNQIHSSLTPAINCARSAEMLEPDNPDILQFLVECYAQQNRFEEELEYLQKLAELQPDNKQVHRLIPIVLSKLGRNEEALQLLFKLDYETTENGKDDEQIVSLIADTALAVGKLDIAERYTAKELELSNAGEWEAHVRQGHIRLLEGDWKSALNSYEQYINTYCDETGKDINAALATLDKQWERLRELRTTDNGQQTSMVNDLLLLHDILQASADASASQNLPQPTER